MTLSEEELRSLNPFPNPHCFFSEAGYWNALVNCLFHCSFLVFVGCLADGGSAHFEPFLQPDVSEAVARGGSAVFLFRLIFICMCITHVTCVGTQGSQEGVKSSWNTICRTLDLYVLGTELWPP